MDNAYEISVARLWMFFVSAKSRKTLGNENDCVTFSSRETSEVLLESLNDNAEFLCMILTKPRMGTNSKTGLVESHRQVYLH